ncbi:MAG: hypothetical protein ACOYOK_09570 [Pseudobdellovibrionaceae bacterium]
MNHDKSKVIEFPNANKKYKLQNQKVIFAISVASVIVTTLVVQKIISKLNTDENTRTVASANPLVLEVSEQDQKWAQKLSEEKSIPTMSEKPSLQDELLYGYLEGKYGMKLNVSNGKIETLDFIPASLDTPVAITNKNDFLLQYKEIFQYSFDEVQLQSKSTTEEVYVLLSAANAVVGRAFFSLNDSGQVLSLKIMK